MPILVLFSSIGWAQSPVSSPLGPDIDRLAKEVEGSVIEWRRDIHQNPELSNREFRTSKIVEGHLRKLGLEVKTKVAHTGVVGILRGQKDTPVIALRADMDALPITELVEVPFASKNKGVMHACGHDSHTAILMGVAEILTKMRDRLPGTIKFIFQPSEEGAPPGEEGGAALMIKEGVLESPKPDAIFGLHVATVPTGVIGIREGGAMASADRFKIVVKGKGSHGAMPWLGMDPIVIASQIVMGLQTIVSRQTDLTATPAVVTVGMIKGGTRHNIIPAEVEMEGTIRVFESKIRLKLHEQVKKTASSIAESAGATADVSVFLDGPIVYNDPKLTTRMIPTLQRIAGPGKVGPHPQLTAGDDFAFYQEKVPGIYYFLGVLPPGKKPFPPHTPYFFVDEKALIFGVRTMANLAVDFLVDFTGNK
ncbi:MAG: amidohydrolase [Deltaproteobacteria bacterium]|nr:amidohydrolase [Deltaproteobacteria bacterium]